MYIDHDKTWDWISKGIVFFAQSIQEQAPCQETDGAIAPGHSVEEVGV